MTLNDVRDPARLITNWCLARDDLLGFDLYLRETEPMTWLHVYIHRLDGRVNSCAFSLPRLEPFDPGLIVRDLEAMADPEELPELPVADTGQPPRNARNLGYANYPIEPS